MLRVGGWKGLGDIPLEDKKCIVIGAPHTSNWDFFWSYFYYQSIGGTANFIIKKEAFFWPVGYFLKKMGGIPIDRSRGANVIKQVVKQYNSREQMQLAITPEGTRSLSKRWKGGFHQIAKMANVPVYLGVFDYGNRQIGIVEKFEITDDVDADMLYIRRFYKDIVAKYPENFSVGNVD